MTEQLTKEQAIAIAESGEWEKWTDEEIVKLQLFQDRLCVPFDRFHQAIEKVLGRPVWTHEFAFIENLREEYRKERPQPTMAQILDLIPGDKRIIIGL
jgi:hypothetical protein